MNEIEDAMNRLLEFWKNQEIISAANSLDDILHFEFSKNVRLPDDFRSFYLMNNGMLNLYPNYFDNEGFLFYPLEEVTTLEEEFDADKTIVDQNCLIFAEFMHKSWWYGVRISKNEEEYEIGIIPEVSKFKVITKKLEEFIHMYMIDSSILYNY